MRRIRCIIIITPPVPESNDMRGRCVAKPLLSSSTPPNSCASELYASYSKPRGFSSSEPESYRLAVGAVIGGGKTRRFRFLTTPFMRAHSEASIIDPTERQWACPPPNQDKLHQHQRHHKRKKKESYTNHCIILLRIPIIQSPNTSDYSSSTLEAFTGGNTYSNLSIGGWIHKVCQNMNKGHVYSCVKLILGEIDARRPINGLIGVKILCQSVKK